MKYKILFAGALIFTFFCHLRAQDRIITGKITDTKQNPLAGVNVSAKDYPSITTISGVDGEFRIAIFDFTKALIFSFSNMKTKEVQMNDTTDRVMVIMEYKAIRNPYPWSVIQNTYFGQSHVRSIAKDDHPNWEYNGEAGLSSTIEIEYFITQNIGFGAGIGFSIYNSSAYVNNFNNNSNTISRTDQDGDQYYLYTTGTSLDENIRVRTLNFPLKIKFRLKSEKKWSYYADLGIKIMNTMDAQVNAKGQSEWQAYYPEYHVVIYDVADYGFTDYDINSESPLIDYKKLTYSFNASIGASRRIKKQLNLDFGLFIDRGLSDLKYHEPVHEADFLNTVGTIDETILNAFGLMIGLRYQIIKK